MTTLAPGVASHLVRMTSMGQLHATSPGFVLQVARSLTVIEKALKRSKRPYLAFSGGKDSMVLLGLVHQVDPSVPLLWSDDELEYPETVELMELIQASAGDQLVIARGWAEHAGWFRPWTDAPFFRDPLPGTLTAGMDADDWMATRGHDLVFTGLRKDESSWRRDWLQWVEETRGQPIYRVKGGSGRRCCPLADWSADDAFAAIAFWGLPLNLVYPRLESIGVAREAQRVGPLPLTPRATLLEGWPELLERLEARYGRRWR